MSAHSDPASPPLTSPSMDVPRARSVNRRRRLAIYLATTVAGLAAITFGLSRLRLIAPNVDRSTVWIDTVKRGSMLREVQGQGTLVPEDIRWITAVSNARVTRILVQPGAEVTEETVLLILENPELELQALEAERQLAGAQADLVNLQATLDGQTLAQQSQVATLGSDLGDARRRAAADDELAKKGFLSELERGQTRDRASELAGRLEFEKKRVEALGRGHAAQIAAQQQQVERLKSIAQVRRREVDQLNVRAGAKGVLQQLPLQAGQAVTAGALLAKVAAPDKLKAEIRIPETQAKELHLGLPASVDMRNAVVPGKVVRIDPAVQSGSVRIDVALVGPLPAGARPDLSVEGIIELERLDNVLYIGRPASSQPSSNMELFTLEGDGDTAVRVPVRLGRGSVKTIEAVGGLREGDRVILSDMSRYRTVDRIRLR
jgi:HlyD family secretion protein